MTEKEKTRVDAHYWIMRVIRVNSASARRSIVWVLDSFTRYCRSPKYQIDQLGGTRISVGFPILEVSGNTDPQQARRGLRSGITQERC